jgi:mRNA (2'-O-methyladenosine-N6-)-methyltransferase
MGRKDYILGNDINGPSQWINCDIRYFEMSIIGKFDVIIADPPWDIHMDVMFFIRESSCHMVQ